jgi:hypothetical protein
MRVSRGGSLRVALVLAAIACVSSLYEDQVMPALRAWRCVLGAHILRSHSARGGGAGALRSRFSRAGVGAGRGQRFSFGKPG